MTSLTVPLAILLGLATAPHSAAARDGSPDGEVLRLAATLRVDDEGSALPFRIDLENDDGHWRAFLRNEPERIEVPEVAYDGTTLRLSLPHYRSRILARRDADTDRFVGTWTKVRGADRIAEVPFEASPVAEPPAPRRRAVLPKFVGGRWAVRFESDELPAVAIFEQEVGAEAVHGTFLTATGDYRYLVGSIDTGTLTLSCFDGAHAFLFRAQVTDADHLRGRFWSGNWWQETWTARRDASARVPDPFEQTRWEPAVSLSDLAFPSPDGELVSLVDPRLAGRARLLVLFGTWCPNCNDEAPYLVELHDRFADRGLSIVGLAFELTGEREQDMRQLERFRARYDVPFPLLLAGTADKAAATEAFAALDRVRSFPTTVFLTADGRAVSIHSGYAGPATGAAHEELRASFEGRIERLLAGRDGEASKLRAERVRLLTATPWRTSGESPTRELRFEVGEDDSLRTTETARGSTGESATPVLTSLLGDALWLEDELWKVDMQRGVLLDPRDVLHRLHAPGNETPLLERRGATDPAHLAVALQDDSPAVRAEALYDLATRRLSIPDGLRFLARALVLLDDPDLTVRRTAVRFLGRVDAPSATKSLLERLADPNADLRREVVRSLLAIRARASESPDWEPRLRALGETDPDPSIRALAME